METVPSNVTYILVFKGLFLSNVLPYSTPQLAPNLSLDHESNSWGVHEAELVLTDYWPPRIYMTS
jgi:hypothetical protein